jgi:hypothetical protein
VKTREEAITEAQKMGLAYKAQARALRAEGLSIPAIARVMGITDSPNGGLTAKQKVENVLDEPDEIYVQKVANLVK